jgi:hypothetical protein
MAQSEILHAIKTGQVVLSSPLTTHHDSHSHTTLFTATFSDGRTATWERHQTFGVDNSKEYWEEVK